jgi:hypothetical protein
MKHDAIADFQKQTAKGGRSIEIRHESGIYRHITVRSGEGILDVHITTWPGYLAITGDMGDFVLCRLNDMFEFFRHDRVNLGYWAEKAVAGATKEYEESFAREKVKDIVVEYFAENCEGVENGDEIQEILDSFDYENEYALRESIRNSEHEGIFPDFWEVNLQTYTYHFAWCCECIRWAVHEYDKMKGAAK